MTRPRLQLHLSTLLIVSLLAAGPVWLNVVIRTRNVRYGEMEEVHAKRGWPLAYWSYDEEIESSFSPNPAQFESMTLAYDILLCLILLAVAAVAIEWAMRRMKRGAP
jgi:hypothetical protein